MSENDLSYYRRRAEVETELAQQAKRPEVVAAHYQLATLYWERLDHDNTREPMLGA